MLNVKSSKILALGLLLAVGVQTSVSAPSLAEESTGTATPTVKFEANDRIAMKPATVVTQKTDEAQAIDPALERKLRKEVSSYVADMPLSAY
jgi:hypothetical protein